MFTMFKLVVVDSGNSKLELGTIVNAIVSDNNDIALLSEHRQCSCEVCSDAVHTHSPVALDTDYFARGNN